MVRAEEGDRLGSYYLVYATPSVSAARSW